MSVLEYILYPLLALLVIAYVIKSIYDIKHPEKVKARKEAKRKKKEEKENATEENEY